MNTLLKGYVDAKRLTVSNCLYFGKNLMCAGLLELFSYSKQEFFNKDAWDEVTLSHRGKLYANDKPVNNPMRKIFNVGERPETELEIIKSRILNENYEVFDKANGHLFFLSNWKEGGEWMQAMHTKGSLGSEMIDSDCAIFNEQHGYTDRAIGLIEDIGCGDIANATFMFEAIVEHDKHTCYGYMCEKYNENDFVLLSVIIELDSGEVKELSHDECVEIGVDLGCPVVSRETLHFDHDTMKNKIGIEGFVIRFENGDRVKIKTDDYWQARFQKDLQAENLLNIWGSGGVAKAYDKIPEELATCFIGIVNSKLPEWFMATQLRMAENGMYLVDVEDMKFSDMQPAEIMYKQNKLNADNILYRVNKSKSLRKEFVQYALTDTAFIDTLKQEITDYLHDSKRG